MDGNYQLHASASLTLEKQPLAPFLIAEYTDSRGDPDDVAEKRISLVMPRVELSNRSFFKISEGFIIPFLVLLALDGIILPFLE